MKLFLVLLILVLALSPLPVAAKGNLCSTLPRNAVQKCIKGTIHVPAQEQCFHLSFTVCGHLNGHNVAVWAFPKPIYPHVCLPWERCPEY